jgi:uncharacterized membrane protein
MINRPKIKIELNKKDKIVEITCLMILLIFWIGTFAIYPQLPDKIPSHFNAEGQADDFSNRIHIFQLPIIATVIYIGMTLLNKHPHLYNYPAVVTADNARQLYTSATRLIRVLKLLVVVIFCGIALMSVKASLKGGNGLGGWFLPLAIAMMIIPNIFYLLKTPVSNKTPL